MELSELVTAFTSNHLAEAEILKNALEAEGIRCELDGQNQASLTGLLEIRGLVRAEDKERAEEILSEHAELEPEEEQSVTGD
jgi:hypothetical protein